MQSEHGTWNYKAYRFCFLIVILFSAGGLLLTGCKSSVHLAPVEQLDQPPSIRLRQHVVSRGDTLYSISWRYGMDYRELASLNSIALPYTIYPGQKLRLAESAAGVGGGDSLADSPGVQTVAVPDTSSAVSEVQEVAETNSVTPIASSERSISQASVKQEVKQEVEPVSRPASVGGRRWLWPTSGRLISQFSAADPSRKGIDLDGKLGEPVFAAAGGNVVYAGTGLAGYGQLIIIKHDDQFLSAYAHHSRMQVSEGETVKAGQKIAEIGSSGTDRNKLHFEIRQDGKPVDPLEYLPLR